MRLIEMNPSSPCYTEVTVALPVTVELQIIKAMQDKN